MPTPFPHERTAVVTGAASARGIGRATAQKLAAHGWNLAILDLDGAGATALATRLAADHGIQTLGLGVDVTDRTAVHAAISRIEAELPQIVGLANIAGISSPTPFLEETAEGWNRVLAVNLTGVFFVTQGIAATMARHGVGRIVSVSSVSFQRGGGVYSKSAYSVSKGGVVGLMRAVARELGERGITANTVSPGPVDTDIMGGPLTEARKAEMSRNTLIGRVATPEDVAAVVAFLLGEDAGNITGATYDTNGGMQLS
ncbi:MAG: SDR family oxidoreductase [Dactylosporangium sp.]|nr:SDR family oxidoreductase [Dactylosporangium sp.]NNJ59740.1 SDR family oxidoreductase [Dactylosporangium sp.]